MIDFHDRLSRAATQMRESEIRRMGAVAARVADPISLAPGYPDPARFAWDAYRAIDWRVRFTPSLRLSPQKTE